MTVNRQTLTAVNYMLTRLGLEKVTALSASRAAVQAEDLLNEVTQEFQSDAWYFNTESGVKVPATELGYIEIPGTVLAADLDRSRTPVVLRDGALHNLQTRTSIWDKPTNHVTDPLDLTTGNWTDTYATNTKDVDGITGVRGTAMKAGYLVDDSNSVVQKLTQTISTLVDGTRYRLSAYLRNGPDGGAGKCALNLIQGGSTTASLSMLMTSEPPVLRSPISGVVGTGQFGLMEDAVLSQLDAPLDTLNEGFSSFAGLVASWAYVSGEWVHDSSLGALTFDIVSHEDAGQAANTDMFIQAPQITEARTGQSLRLTHCLPYEYLSPVAQEYARSMALILLQDVVLGSDSIRRELLRQASESKARLWKAQADQADSNYLRDTFSAARFSQGYLNPLLFRGGGAPTFQTTTFAV